MSSIDAVKKLRDLTGLSIMKCKEALEESNGDMDKAQEILRKKGSLSAEKKANRELGAGIVQAYIHNTNNLGTMVELLCETDFVARNEEFISLAKDIAMHITAMSPKYVKRESVPSEVLEQLKGELLEEIDSSKSKDIQDKVLEGKLDAKLKDYVLLEQKFIKDDTRTIKDLIDSAVQKFGEKIDVGQFITYRI